MLDAGSLRRGSNNSHHHLAAQTPEIVVVTPNAVKFLRERSAGGYPLSARPACMADRRPLKTYYTW
jgi:hypothetical protein